MPQGQGAELHCLDLKMGHFIPGAQKQKGALVAIRSSFGASLAAAGWSCPGRAWSRELGLSFWQGGKAWELGTGLGKRGAGGIRLGLGGMTTCPGRKQRQRWLGLMEETFNSSFGIWMGCGLIPRPGYLTKTPPVPLWSWKSAARSPDSSDQTEANRIYAADIYVHTVCLHHS